MPAVSVTNTFSAGATIIAGDHNTNFTDLVNYINNRNDATTAWDLCRVTASPTTSIALIVNNSTGTVNVASFRDNGTDVLTIADGGTTTVTANGGTGNALVVNNGTSTGGSLVVQDNGGMTFQVIDGGATSISATAGGTAVTCTLNNRTSTGSILIVQDNGATINTIFDGGGVQWTNGSTGTAASDGLLIDVPSGTTEARFNQQENDVMTFYTNAAEVIRFTNVGQLKIAGTATRATTEGTNHLDIFNGTAPAGTLANGISLYSTTGELRVMDSGGTATLLSPHDKETGEWIFLSKNTVTGEVLKIDTERLLRTLDKQLGGGFVHEYKE